MAVPAVSVPGPTSPRQLMATSMPRVLSLPRFRNSESTFSRSPVVPLRSMSWQYSLLKSYVGLLVPLAFRQL
jgi:hypothetical protein